MLGSSLHGVDDEFDAIVEQQDDDLKEPATVVEAEAQFPCTARGGREAIWRETEDQRVIFHTDRGTTA